MGHPSEHGVTQEITERFHSPGDGSGNGRVAKSGEFPLAASARLFLDKYLEGWRRLECGEAPGVSLTGLPLGLGVLSLQVKFARITVYAYCDPSFVRGSGDTTTSLEAQRSPFSTLQVYMCNAANHDAAKSIIPVGFVPLLAHSQ